MTVIIDTTESEQVGRLIARPKGVLPKAARPKGGLFRYNVKRIHFTMQGFGFLSAIFDEAKLKASYYYYGSAAII